MNLFNFFSKKQHQNLDAPEEVSEDTCDSVQSEEGEGIITSTSTWTNQTTHVTYAVTRGFTSSGEYFSDCTGKPDDFTMEFYYLSDFIKSGKNSIESRLDACEKGLEMLPEMVRFDTEICGSLPPFIYCRDYGIELNLRLGKFEDAERVVHICISAKAYTQEEGDEVLEVVNAYHKAYDVALAYIKDHPGCLQKDLYKILGLEGIEREQLKHFLRNSLQIKKEKFKNTNQLYINIDSDAQ